MDEASDPLTRTAHALAEVGYRQGNELRHAAAASRDADQLQLAIECHQQALTHCLPGSPARFPLLDTLALDHFTRYQWHSALEDLETAIHHWREAAGCSAGIALLDPVQVAGYHTNLGSGLILRYQRLGAIEDLAQARRAVEAGLRQAPPDWLKRPAIERQLAAIRQRGEQRIQALAARAHALLGDTGSQGRRAVDWDEAIELLRQAVALADAVDDPSQYLLVRWGCELHDRFKDRGDDRDLYNALTAWRRALALPLEAPATAERLIPVFQRMMATTQAELLELAPSEHPGLAALIDHFGREAERTHACDAERIRALERFACLVGQFKGDPASIERAIGIATSLLTGGGTIDRPTALSLHDLLCRCYVVRRPRGEPAHGEQAIFHGSEALRLSDREARPEAWAACQLNLAHAWRQRVLGEKAENMELSIRHLKLALEERRRDRHPVPWSMIQNALGIAYLERVVGDPTDNAETAIGHLTLSLEVRTRDAFPGKWADTMAHLANAHDQLARAGGDHVEQALAFLQELMAIRRGDLYPREWAMNQHRLGGLHLRRERGDPVENARRATECYEAGLTAIDRHHDAWLHGQLHLAAAAPCERRRDIAGAIAHLRSAMDTFERLPAGRVQAARSLSQLMFRERRWEEAHAAFRIADQAAGVSYAQAYTQEGRRAEMAALDGAHATDCWSLLQMGRHDEALERMEGGRARLLSLALGLLDPALDDIPGTLRDRLHAASDAVALLEYQMREAAALLDEAAPRALAEDLRVARHRWQEMVGDVRRVAPSFMREGLRATEILDSVPPGSALVAPVITGHGGMAFVIPAGTKALRDEHVLALPELDLDALRQLLVLGSGHQPGWLAAYVAKDRDPAPWIEFIEDFGATLWRCLMGPIADRLAAQGIGRLLLMPAAGLGVLPLHAAWRDVAGQRRYFLDDFIVSSTPSAAAHRTARGRATVDSGLQARHLLAIGTSARDLPFAAAECAAIARGFESSSMDMPTAQAPGEILSSPRASHIHIASHGRYDWKDVYRSGVELANGDLLTLARISARWKLPGTRLVVLSACETGMTDLQQSPDEYIGLATGFLAAGACGVVSTLWPVADLSTMLLMQRFYALLDAHADQPAGALRDAQRWLRTLSAADLTVYFMDEEDAAAAGTSPLPLALASQGFARFASLPPDERPFAHPYFWAAFTFSGA